MWTNLQGKSIPEPLWRPNHFVALFPVDIVSTSSPGNVEVVEDFHPEIERSVHSISLSFDASLFDTGLLDDVTGPQDAVAYQQDDTGSQDYDTTGLHEDTTGLTKDTTGQHEDEDTTGLHKDTACLHEDTACLHEDTTGLHDDEDTTCLHEDTTGLPKDTTGLLDNEDTTGLHKDTTGLTKDTTGLHGDEDTTDPLQDTTGLHEDITCLHEDTTVLHEDTTGLHVDHTRDYIKINDETGQYVADADNKHMTDYRRFEFVVVLLPVGKSQKPFVAQILVHDDDEVFLKYLKHDPKDDIYTWPVKEDTSWELMTSIQRSLPPPSIKTNRRGKEILIFKN